MAAALQVGRFDDAAKQLDAALALAPTGSTELRGQLLTLKTHYSSLSGKGGKPDAKDSAAAAARAAAQIVLSSKLAGDAAKAVISEAWKRADPDHSSPAAALPVLELALLAWAACASGNPELCEDMCRRVAASQDLRPRTWTELCRSHMKMAHLDPQVWTVDSLQVRKQVLDDLEQCIRSFQRAGDIAGTEAACRCASHNRCQSIAGHTVLLTLLLALPTHRSLVCLRPMSFLEMSALLIVPNMLLDFALPFIGHFCVVCRCMWNAGLPLLQHNLRHHIKRPFTTACGALKATASSQHELRVLLHLELAKCDAAEELLMPAKQHAAAAAALDYTGKTEDAKHFHLARPLDRHVMPLLTSLGLRTNVDGAPGAPEEQAQLMLERAREAKAMPAKKLHLEQALAKLRSLGQHQPPAAASELPADVATQHAARRLTELWADVVKVAYQSECFAEVLQAAPHVMWFRWSSAVDKEMVALQVRIDDMLGRNNQCTGCCLAFPSIAFLNLSIGEVLIVLDFVVFSAGSVQPAGGRGSSDVATQ